MNNSVFLAAPISGFALEKEYLIYRQKAVKLISYLRDNGYKVCSELESVSSSGNYDSPGNSVYEDFKNIKDSDFFLLLHPSRMQTSSLIEFGYACAFDKTIVVVGRKEDLPYLVIGYEEYSDKATIIDTERLSEDIFPRILDALMIK